MLHQEGNAKTMLQHFIWIKILSEKIGTLFLMVG